MLKRVAAALRAWQGADVLLQGGTLVRVSSILDAARPEGPCVPACQMLQGRGEHCGQPAK